MKKLLVVAGILLGLTVAGWCLTETVDVEISSKTMKTASVSSGNWVVLISSHIDVWISTTTTGDSSTSYRMVYYNVRNTGTPDLYISLDENASTDDCFNIRANEVYKETCRKTQYGRLANGQTSTTTVKIELNYIRR